LREELSSALKPILADFPALHVEEVVKKADPMDGLLWAMKKYAAELIVVGTQGAHESPDIFIGSTTGALIKLGDAPVLAIPSGSVFTPYKRVLFAVKHPYVASAQVLAPFLMLMDHFKATVDLLHVTRDSTPDLSRYPNPYPIPPHTHELHTSDSDNIYHSVQTHLKGHTADLLVVISRLRGFFEGLFAQSATSASMFNSDLPILVLHGGVRD
jgi:nucleotide-binding universal stress UspA family protein